MMDSSIVAIYEKVDIIGLTLDWPLKATARAGESVVWKRSKRLIAPVSSLRLFRSQCVVAAVAARPLEGKSNTLFFSKLT
jgi:hypothetical protein